MSLPTQEELRALLHYVPTTGELFWKERPRSMFTSERGFSTWNSRYANQPAFTAISRKGYKVGGIHDKIYRASRVIFKWYYGVDADQVDHENGNRLDNRIKNLRNVCGQQNQQNMKKACNNVSGVTGVSWNTAKNRWDCKIKVNGKPIHLGRFVDFNEAVVKRKEAEILYGFHPNHGHD